MLVFNLIRKMSLFAKTSLDTCAENRKKLIQYWDFMFSQLNMNEWNDLDILTIWVQHIYYYYMGTTCILSYGYNIYIIIWVQRIFYYHMGTTCILLSYGYNMYFIMWVQHIYYYMGTSYLLSYGYNIYIIIWVQHVYYHMGITYILSYGYNIYIIIWVWVWAM